MGFRLLKIGGLILLSLLSLMLTAQPSSESADGAMIAPTESPAAAPVVADECLPRWSYRVVVNLDGVSPLFDTPERLAIRFTLPAGAVVRMVDGVRFRGEAWCLVEVVSDGSKGWLTADQLLALNGPYMGNFLLCGGTVAHPAPERDCTRHGPLPLDPDAMWLRWDYAGLRDADVVQWMLVINGERYQTPPIVWKRGRGGQQLVNLLAANPRVEPGAWTIKVIVNGRTVGEHTFTVLGLGP